jgi:DNA-binding transcriptional LysR family regulator
MFLFPSPSRIRTRSWRISAGKGSALGVVGALCDDKRIVQSRIVEDDMRLILPAGHPLAKRTEITVQELQTLPFIVRERGSGTLKSIAQSLSRAGCRMEDLRIAAEMGNTQAVVEGIKSGAGVSILSTLAVAADLATQRLEAVRIRDVDLKRSFYLSRHRHKSLSPLGEALSSFLENNRAEGLAGEAASE